MSKIDERLAEIRARVDGATPDDLGFIDGYAQPAMLANARADLGYLLDLVAGLRATNADLRIARQERERVAEVRLERTEELRQQLTTHAAEANSVCQEWDARCQGLEAEAADLRKRLVGAHQVENILREELDTVTDLVPSAGLLERLACAIEGSLAIPGIAELVPQIRADGRMAGSLAARIRAWRGDGDGREEQEEGDKS